MRRWSGLVALALMVGCARENPLYSESDTGSASSAAPSTSGTSAGSTTGATASVGATTTAVETAADGEESGKHEDTGALSTTTSESDGSSTSSVRERSCPYAVDDNVVAHYRFDDPEALWVDETGDHDGMTYSGMPLSLPGPDGCGEALGITPEFAGRVADATAFDLVSGSVDFWVFFAELPVVKALDETTPLLSRDSAGAVNEHLTFFVSEVDFPAQGRSPGHVIVRHQSMGNAAAVCSEQPLPEQTWVHVGYNFGPAGMELFIDGVPQAVEAQPIVPGGGIPTCDGVSNNGSNTSFAGGLEADLPWYVGASAINSNKLNQLPTSHMNTGALDEIRISDVRRDFSAL